MQYGDTSGRLPDLYEQEISGIFFRIFSNEHLSGFYIAPHIPQRLIMQQRIPAQDSNNQMVLGIHTDSNGRFDVYTTTLARYHGHNYNYNHNSTFFGEQQHRNFSRHLNEDYSESHWMEHGREVILCDIFKNEAAGVSSVSMGIFESQRLGLIKQQNTPDDKLLRFCQRFAGARLFTMPHIPQPYIEVAQENFGLSPEVRIVAIFDNSIEVPQVFLICGDGLRWFSSYGGIFMPWKEYKNATIQVTVIQTKYSIEDDDKVCRVVIGDKFDFINYGMWSVALLNFLSSLQDEVRKVALRKGNLALSPKSYLQSEVIKQKSPSLHTIQIPLPISPLIPTRMANGFNGLATSTQRISASTVSPVKIAGKKTTAPQPTQLAIVDINNATIDQLLLLPGVSRGAAETIIKERKLRRGFKTIEDVAEVLSLQPHQAEQLKKAAKVAPIEGAKTTSSARSRVLDID